MSEPQDPAEAAFEALRGEVALLRRAVEALAAAPDPVDYGPVVEGLTAEMSIVAHRVADLVAQSPTTTRSEFLAYAREFIGEAIVEPKEAMWKALTLMVEASGRLVNVAGVLQGRRAQARRLWWVGIGSSVLAVVVWTALSGPIARLAPARWGWAEGMAAASLGLPPWQASERLMETADPARWRAQAQALAWVSEHRPALEDCARRAQARKRAVRCQIHVAPSGAEP